MAHGTLYIKIMFIGHFVLSNNLFNKIIIQYLVHIIYYTYMSIGYVILVSVC